MIHGSEYRHMNTTYHRVLWRQVWGLAALLAAILFSWMAYGFYQPVILTKLGFIQLAESLGIVQGFMGAAIEPLVGAMSDRLMRRVGSRLPAIAVGVTLSGLLFITIGLILHGNISMELRWIIPILMTFWVISMIIFRGPAIALLRQFAPTEALPVANSILTVVFGLVGALAPIFGRVIEFLGAANTFLFGAVMLMIGAILLWSADPDSMVYLEADIPSSSTSLTLKNQSTNTLLIQRIIIFGVGLIAGFLANILLRVCPQKLHLTLSNISSEYIAALILLVCALSAIPLESRVKKWGINRSMVISLLSISIAIISSSVFHLTVISISIVLFGGVAMGLLFITQIPWCLGRLLPHQAGLSTGLYFGGMGGATALVTLISG